MAIHRTHKQSDLEKRFKHLEFQLYGKPEKKERLDVRSKKLDEEVGNLKLENQTSNIQPHNLPSNLQHPTSNTDVVYLRQDLLKIALFASVALVAQFLLYFGQIRNIIKLF